MKTLICALNWRDAEEARRDYGLARHDVVVVRDFQDVRGRSDFLVITTPRFYNRPDAREISAIIAHRLAIRAGHSYPEAA